jgi:hypothetical protein
VFAAFATHLTERRTLRVDPVKIWFVGRSSEEEWTLYGFTVSVSTTRSST